MPDTSCNRELWDTIINEHIRLLVKYCRYSMHTQATHNWPLWQWAKNMEKVRHRENSNDNSNNKTSNVPPRLKLFTFDFSKRLETLSEGMVRGSFLSQLVRCSRISYRKAWLTKGAGSVRDSTIPSQSTSCRSVV